MGTYGTTPRKFVNGTNYADAKTTLDAEAAKKRRETEPYIFHDPWRERHPRRRPPDQQQRPQPPQKEGV